MGVAMLCACPGPRPPTSPPCARACGKGGRKRREMEAGEVEFLAEKELVTITPNFSENKITMISVSEVATPIH